MLHLDDVLVMVPNMKEYAPLIKAEFESSNDGTGLPVSIPLQPSLFLENDISKVLTALEGAIKISDFIELLESDLIKTNFGFSEQDVLVIQRWMVKQHTHWGLDTNDSPFSIERALHDLMSGYAMEPARFETYEELIPFNEINSTDQAILLSKFSSLVHVLISIKNETKGAKSISAWLGCFESWLNLIKRADSTQSMGWGKIQQALTTLKEYAVFEAGNSKIDYPLFKDWLLAAFSETAASSGTLGKGITLSTYIPYRGIPFKCVCLLGFGEGAFPRTSIRPHFDLIHSNPGRGIEC